MADLSFYRDNQRKLARDKTMQRESILFLTGSIDPETYMVVLFISNRLVL